MDFFCRQVNPLVKKQTDVRRLGRLLNKYSSGNKFVTKEDIEEKEENHGK